jgi:hypothetical protein
MICSNKGMPGPQPHPDKSAPDASSYPSAQQTSVSPHVGTQTFDTRRPTLRSGIFKRNYEDWFDRDDDASPCTNSSIARGYLYIGSHNCTQSAWGDIQGKKEQKLKISNYELGIILPFSADGRGVGVAGGLGQLFVNFMRPGKEYGERDVPWSFAL